MNKIIYGLHQTFFGKCLIAVEQNNLSYKICYLAFTDNYNIDLLKKEIYHNNKVHITENLIATKKILKLVLSKHYSNQFDIALNGTKFQIQVWQALRTIPFGTTTSYQQIAALIKKPKATRAVANSIAKNKVSFLIPCHRVIRKSGELSGYRWGVDKKQLLLEWEQSLINDIA